MTVERFEIRGWDEKETGLIVLENEEWVLVKHIPVDYVVDGYKLYKKQFINSRGRGEGEKKIERVLQLKEIRAGAPKGFSLGSTAEILKWCEVKFGLFEFQSEDEEELFYGRINAIEGARFIIDMISTNGEVEFGFDHTFYLAEVRVITFGTDYFNSIRLLWQDENRRCQ